MVNIPLTIRRFVRPLRFRSGLRGVSREPTPRSR